MLLISEISIRDEHQREQEEIGAETLSCTRHSQESHTCVAINEIYRKQQEAAKSKRAAINAVLLEGTKVDTRSYT